jgi:hypothetical protein
MMPSTWRTSPWRWTKMTLYATPSGAWRSHVSSRRVSGTSARARISIQIDDALREVGPGVVLVEAQVMLPDVARVAEVAVVRAILLEAAGQPCIRCTPKSARPLSMAARAYALPGKNV